jgi:hypothetical protein
MVDVSGSDLTSAVRVLRDALPPLAQIPPSQQGGCRSAKGSLTLVLIGVHRPCGLMVEGNKGQYPALHIQRSHSPQAFFWPKGVTQRTHTPVTHLAQRRYTKVTLRSRIGPQRSHSSLPSRIWPKGDPKGHTRVTHSARRRYTKVHSRCDISACKRA